MTTYKLEDASKEGYKKLTIAFKSTRKWTPTKKKVDKLINTCYKKNGWDYAYVPFVEAYSVADYDTGVSLEGNNDFGVKVKSFKGKASGLKKYKGKTKGNWIKIYKTATIKFQITYPESYTGLCIGLLGDNAKCNVGKPFVAVNDGSEGSGDIDAEYFDATKWTKIKKDKYKEDEKGTPFKFGQTTFYLKGKKNSHWLRVK